MLENRGRDESVSMKDKGNKAVPVIARENVKKTLEARCSWHGSQRNTGGASPHPELLYRALHGNLNSTHFGRLRDSYTFFEVH